jgi:hypothetical protein
LYAGGVFKSRGERCTTRHTTTITTITTTTIA